MFAQFGERQPERFHGVAFPRSSCRARQPTWPPWIRSFSLRSWRILTMPTARPFASSIQKMVCGTSFGFSLPGSGISQQTLNSATVAAPLPTGVPSKPFSPLPKSGSNSRRPGRRRQGGGFQSHVFRPAHATNSMAREIPLVIGGCPPRTDTRPVLTTAPPYWPDEPAPYPTAAAPLTASSGPWHLEAMRNSCIYSFESRLFNSSKPIKFK